jgi:hypothetical protein
MEWIFSGYKIKICSWKGRLGNNLVQLMNAIFLAKRSKSLLEYPYHQFIRNKVFDFRERGNKKNCGMIVSDPSNFFYLNRVCPEKWKMTLQDKRDICRNYVRKLLTFALPHSNLKAYHTTPPLINWETTLVVHMRSGDVYCNDHVHPDYPQPPLSFYTKVVQDAIEDVVGEVLIVSEKDATNPCISALKGWCKEKGLKCYSQSKTMQGDATTLLNARFLVTTRSSFSEMTAATPA